QFLSAALHAADPAAALIRSEFSRSSIIADFAWSQVQRYIQPNQAWIVGSILVKFRHYCALSDRTFQNRRASVHSGDRDQRINFGKFQASWCRRQIAAMSEMGFVSRISPVHTAVCNCTRDEGGPFEVGNQVLISSHRKLLWSKATVVNVAEKPEQDSGRHD